jgi:hypothetical protein
VTTERPEAPAADVGRAQADYCVEQGLPMFASIHGTCWGCGVNLGKYYSVESAGRTHITGCPNCARSYCD